MSMIDEFVAVGATIVATALIIKGDVASAVALYGTVIGYTLGRQRAVNGELAKAVAVAEKKLKK